MNLHTQSSKRTNESNLELFRVRLIAKLCIVLVCAIQFVPRLTTVFITPVTSTQTGRFILISLAFIGAMIIFIAVEYVLFKKKGPKMIKYSDLVDLTLLLLFIGDWVTVLLSSLAKIKETDASSFRISALYGFTSFAWRALLVTLIVQKWQLKVLPPLIATILATVYAVHYNSGDVVYILIRSIGQIVTLIIVIYFEDKVKWRMLWSNLQKEKWIQVNNFILNNIPENIMIVNFAGEVKFISDYCRNFMESCNFSLEKTKEFFNKIKDLQQQYELGESTKLHTEGLERLVTGNGLLSDVNEGQTVLLRVETLENLITNFRKISETKVLEERQFLIYNGKLKNEEGVEKSIEIKVSFVNHIENEYIILILRDTTQRDLLVALEETNKYKDQLLASVSHELRAPLNGNINLVESAVNSCEIPEKIKETLLVPALRSSKFLLHIINDILDMSQIKEKKLRLVYQSEDIKETLKSTAQLVELQAKKKGIDLSLEFDPKLPQRFCSDHIRLSQIVLNLLNNAIKFTKEGVVKLTASCIDEASAKIQVEDTGIGMTQDNVKKLFSSYTHIEFEGRRMMNPTGVGLGLNIAYSLAELLAPKGQQGICVTSAPGQGTIFSFVIENKEKLDSENSIDSEKIAEESPELVQSNVLRRSKISASITPLFRKQQGGSEESIAIDIEPESCQCAKILVVDDNPFNTMAFETVLSSLQVKCDSVYSGACAIKKLLNRENEKCGHKDCHPYSVVFMDQEMPEMSGSEATMEIRRLQKETQVSPKMKIVGCTAHKSKEEVKKFMEAGLDKCIHKPISPSMIKDILKNESFLL